MAYITGQTEQGCCLPVQYLGDGWYECAPAVSELHKKHRIYNDYHMWYVKIIGKVGERVSIRLCWPKYDPALVSEEYRAWDSYATDWPSFYPTVREVLYYSVDEIHWERITDAVNGEDETVVFSLTLPASTVYVCSTLHYTPANYRDLMEYLSASPYARQLSLGPGWDGCEVPTFVVTDPSVPDDQKMTVYLQGAQHCHEHTGAHVCDFALRYLVSAPEALPLLRRFIFRMTPVVDLAGWRLGGQVHPMRTDSMCFNMNRDWGVFSLRETRAVNEYLEACVSRGERFVFLADLHGGTGDEDDHSSGASITWDNQAPPAVLAEQRRFVDMVRARCDYLDPSETNYGEWERAPHMFTAYAQRKFGPTYTFEISMSKIWDRAAGRRYPNEQFRYKRLAEQLMQVIGALRDEQ